MTSPSRLLSVDQLRAIYFLASPCSHGCDGPTYEVTQGPTQGKYCAGCVDDLVGMFSDSHSAGRMHGRGEAKETTTRAEIVAGS